MNSLRHTFHSACIRSYARCVANYSSHGVSNTVLPNDGLELSDFFKSQAGHEREQCRPSDGDQTGRNYFIETYGCQMNVNDSEVVGKLLQDKGYSVAPSAEEADVVLLNTCAIRENAESKIWQRLGYFKNLKLAKKQKRASHVKKDQIVGVLGCMAERLKHKLLESDKLVDMVVGPDAYRDLPRLIDIVSPQTEGSYQNKAMNVQLSADETYADVIPVRQGGTNSVFLSIMRGCNNMCSFCVVPFTRGRERSRPMKSILEEVRYLSDNGVKEVTLLGQNVNSYADFSEQEKMIVKPDPSKDYFGENYAKGFTTVYKPLREGAINFAELLSEVASVDPEMRIRFTSPHPKDFSDDVISAIKSHDNICKQLHMPAQSGSTNVLKRMNRGYSREAYDDLVAHIRSQIPGVALSTDMIAGFCGETEEDHQASVDLMRSIKYDLGFLFAYSRRDKTHAAKKYIDDVPEDVKKQRLQELIFAYRQGLSDLAADEVGRRHIVLVEGPARKSENQLTGRTDTFKRVVFSDIKVPSSYLNGSAEPVSLEAGDYVAVQIVGGGTGATLKGTPLGRTTIQEFTALHGTTVPLT
ncbi:hypothetical protein M9434_003635 [Picochlorum sp. BPE23]|nr:hypothetical protein M9434_003635 [Picochlorum sp. BPE23]KAI8113207.1 hypothetical protein M9435_003211 [Picochlorum sp. BPE23]